jgi:hypothetical protein
MKRIRPPRDVKPLPDLTAPKYPSTYLQPVKRKKAGGWKNHRMNEGSPGAPLMRGGKVSPR